MASPVNFLIVHGANGNPQINWFPWLKQQLEPGGKILVPAFPTPKGQTLTNWLKVADDALTGCDPANTILIGHSSGALLVLRMAERAKQPYRAVFAICPFERALGLPDYDPLNASFVQPPYNGAAVRRGTQRLVCFAGDNDPYVPLAYSQEIADKTEAEFILVSRGGHLNSESGMTEFPLLLEKIRQVIVS